MASNAIALAGIAKAAAGYIKGRQQGKLLASDLEQQRIEREYRNKELAYALREREAAPIKQFYNEIQTTQYQDRFTPEELDAQVAHYDLVAEQHGLPKLGKRPDPYPAAIFADITKWAKDLPLTADDMSKKRFLITGLRKYDPAIVKRVLGSTPDEFEQSLQPTGQLQQAIPALMGNGSAETVGETYTGATMTPTTASPAAPIPAATGTTGPESMLGGLFGNDAKELPAGFTSNPNLLAQYFRTTPIEQMPQGMRSFGAAFKPTQLPADKGNLPASLRMFGGTGTPQVAPRLTAEDINKPPPEMTQQQRYAVAKELFNDMSARPDFYAANPNALAQRIKMANTAMPGLNLTIEEIEIPEPLRIAMELKRAQTKHTEMLTKWQPKHWASMDAQATQRIKDAKFNADRTAGQRDTTLGLREREVAVKEKNASKQTKLDPSMWQDTDGTTLIDAQIPVDTAKQNYNRAAQLAKDDSSVDTVKPWNDYMAALKKYNGSLSRFSHAAAGGAGAGKNYGMQPADTEALRQRIQEYKMNGKGAGVIAPLVRQVVKQFNPKATEAQIRDAGVDLMKRYYEGIP
jgi:hypothetical protein